VKSAIELIDSDIAPSQVFFERDLGRGIDGEAAVARRALPLDV